MNKALKITLEVALLAICAFIAYAIVQSIMEPVNFNKQTEARKAVAVQRLKDIRTLEVAYKGVTGHYTADLDSLILFYNSGKMDITMQVGSNDDSLAVVNTEKLKKQNRKITPQEMYERYLKGENLVFSIKNSIPVKDTLFKHRADFVIDSIKYIPFSGKQIVETDAIIKTVSGVEVPLFEAKMPYRALLKGLDNQLRINLDADCRASNRYEGLQVGSITAPNNNAGNWE
ncbi:MAG: hypothetical protein IJ795_01310 [Bacteroidales bacterium]|nr:hypothetical protein [Bacteroidales bacterium]